MTANDERSGLLAGIRILDLADEKASFCSKLLADLGAYVLKIERPGGDPSREVGPFWQDAPHRERSLSFCYHNTNKRGILLDLEDRAGRETFLGLLRRFNVLLETFPPGYLNKIGLGLEVLGKANPDLVMVSVTGFGQDGPRSQYKSCDLVASAFGGQMYVSGSPSTPPLKPNGGQSYAVASLFAAIAVLLALRKQACIGRGEQIDISLQEAVVSTLDHVTVRYFYEKIVSQRQGGLHWNGAFCILPCRDGHILMTPFYQWETLVEWMASEAKEEDLRDEAYLDEEYRLKRIDHIVEVLRRWTKTHTTEELFQLGQLMRFPWAPVQSPKDLLDDPQLKARRFFIDIDHPELETVIKYPGSPYTFSSSPLKRWKRAPFTGEDNHQIHHLGSRLSERGIPGPSCSNPMPEGSMKKATLNGVRVLDFTWMLAGPYATRLLADFGAEVIKVQSGKTARGAESNLSGYFNTWNRNKRSITLDMSFPESKEMALRLAAISDIAIENFSPRVMSNWGLDYERLREANPNLIMVSMSGMGRTGPRRDFVAFGPTLQALSGLTYLTSYSQDSPLGLGYSYADPIAGLYAALATLAALEHRDRTGEGQHIDISEYEAICTLMGPSLLDAFVNQAEVLPKGNRPDDLRAAPYGCYRCAGTERWCVIAVFNEGEWQSFSEVIGRPSWAREDRFATPSGRRRHAEELDRLIEEWTVEHTAEEVVGLLQDAGVPSGVVQNAEDLAKDPHLMARGFFSSLEHPCLGKTLSDASPMRFKDPVTEAWKAAPLLGEDNRYVYMELLGLTEEEFSSCVRKGVIG